MKIMSNKNTPESFWKRVDVKKDDVCWNWKGAKNNSGYGTLKYQGVSVSAHRLAFKLCGNDVPLVNPMKHNEKQFVLHSCDNPACCNPKHLRLGTHQENMQEAHARNRIHHKNGTDHIQSVLTANQQTEIKLKFLKGSTQKELSIEYSVSKGTIYNALNRPTKEAA